MIKVPNFQELGLSKFLNDLLLDLDKTNRDTLSKVTANHSVLLQSPGNIVWEVKVDDAGVLSTTKVQG
jgi:hypothetical protein